MQSLIMFMWTDELVRNDELSRGMEILGMRLYFH